MTSPRPAALRELVKRRLLEEGLSYQDVADRGHLPKATVANLATGDLVQVPRPETIVGLARGLGLPLSEVQASIASALGLAPAEPEGEDPLTRRIRHSLPDLTDDDREDLAALVASMLRRRRKSEP